MTHGLYNGFLTHDLWVVQHFSLPWVMGCTTLFPPMTHGLYNTLKDIHYSYLTYCTVKT